MTGATYAAPHGRCHHPRGRHPLSELLTMMAPGRGPGGPGGFGFGPRGGFGPGGQDDHGPGGRWD